MAETTEGVSTTVKIVCITMLILIGGLSVWSYNNPHTSPAVSDMIPNAINDLNISANENPLSINENIPLIFTTDSVTVQQLFAELEQYAVTTLEPSATLKKEFTQLVASHNIVDSEQNYKDYVRVRLAFEATRDGGFWGMRWAITDKEPTSKNVWQQWQGLSNTSTVSPKKATATAECDELSALFAVVARGLGVKDVGLFWPTWNHTVAVWTVTAGTNDEKRIVIPTSQTFLSRKATLGTKEFDAYAQKVIYNYEAKDIALTDTLSAPLANMMMHQVHQYAHLPLADLQKRRNAQAKKLKGS